MNIDNAIICELFPFVIISISSRMTYVNKDRL
jgi:hypothetical protein